MLRRFLKVARPLRHCDHSSSEVSSIARSIIDQMTHVDQGTTLVGYLNAAKTEVSQIILDRREVLMTSPVVMVRRWERPLLIW